MNGFPKSEKVQCASVRESGFRLSVRNWCSAQAWDPNRRFTASGAGEWKNRAEGKMSKSCQSSTTVFDMVIA